MLPAALRVKDDRVGDGVGDGDGDGDDDSDVVCVSAHTAPGLLCFPPLFE
jgi:hypothetical protein